MNIDFIKTIFNLEWFFRNQNEIHLLEKNTFRLKEWINIKKLLGMVISESKCNTFIRTKSR